MAACGRAQEWARSSASATRGEPPAAFIGGFRRGLHEVGLIEGRDFIIEFAPQNSAHVPGAAAEVVRRGVDILLASGTPSVLPARDAAGQIPVVFVRR